VEKFLTKELTSVNTFLLVSIIVLWSMVLVGGFLLLGTLRTMGLLSWRLEQLEATTPSRIGRGGLKVGKKAPDFTLPRADSGELSLHDFAGQKVLLVFTQSGCGPCKTIIPDLNRVHDQGEHQVLVINNSDPQTTRKWAVEAGARVPVLVQERFSQSKRYEVFATPFAFLIDEQGNIASKGIVGTGQHLGYVLTGAGNRAKRDLDESEPDREEKRETQDSISSTSLKEMTHA
jgi:methylamine dehydrogenase accessory protein MauD